MYMTSEEICKEYRTAKNKANQIKILAELNLCRTSEIIRILQEGGIPVGSRTKGTLKNEILISGEPSPEQFPAQNPESAPPDWKTSLKTVTERIVELKLIRDNAEKELAEIYQTLGALCGKS